MSINCWIIIAILYILGMFQTHLTFIFDEEARLQKGKKPLTRGTHIFAVLLWWMCTLYVMLPLTSKKHKT